jgi:NAD(P)-dependent dehydrogenase (short-subunit alcohol dehydrogenase family)
MTKMKLKGRVALITGGAEGIGKAIARAYVAEGACITIADINLPLAEQTKAEIGENALAVEVDVRRWEQITSAVKKTLDRFGRLDILVNNAGIVKKGWAVDISEEVWDEVLDINLKGSFLCSKAVLPTMIRQKYGRIIIVSSIAGKLGQATDTPYSASKFGQIGLTQALALEVAQHNILVNAICPGPIPTRLGEGGFEQAARLRGMETEQFQKTILSRTPLGKLGTVESVAKMAVFLASDDCDFTTGSAFNVSGGMIMY